MAALHFGQGWPLRPCLIRLQGSTATIGVPAILLEDFRPQAILKFHRPSSLDWRACHGLPVQICKYFPHLRLLPLIDNFSFCKAQVLTYLLSFVGSRCRSHKYPLGTQILFWTKILSLCLLWTASANALCWFFQKNFLMVMNDGLSAILTPLKVVLCS